SLFDPVAHWKRERGVSLCPPVLRSTLWGAHPGEAQRARASGPARSIGRTLQVRFCRTLRFNLTTRPGPRRTGTVMSEPFRPYEKLVDIVIFGKRSEERRVGKECRSGG